MCNGSPLANAYVSVLLNNERLQYTTTNSDGSFRLSGTVCPGIPTRILIITVETGLEQKWADKLDYIPAGTAAYDSGILTLECQPEHLVIFTVDNQTYSIAGSFGSTYISLDIVNNQRYTVLRGISTAAGFGFEYTRNIQLELPTPGLISGVGTYPVLPSVLAIADLGDRSPWRSNWRQQYTFSGGELTVSEFTNLGEGRYMISGSYTGRVLVRGTTTTLPFSLSFSGVQYHNQNP